MMVDSLRSVFVCVALIAVASCGGSNSSSSSATTPHTPNPFGPGGTLTGNVVGACGVTLFGFVPPGQ